MCRNGLTIVLTADGWSLVLAHDAATDPPSAPARTLSRLTDTTIHLSPTGDDRRDHHAQLVPTCLPAANLLTDTRAVTEKLQVGDEVREDRIEYDGTRTARRLTNTADAERRRGAHNTSRS